MTQDWIRVWTFLRRQSSLDARAALFVLSPVSTNELQDFVEGEPESK